MRKNYICFINVILTLILGFIGGLLFAPYKGIYTRKLLKYKLQQYKEKLSIIMHDIIESKTEKNSTIIKDEGKKIVEEACKKASSLLNEVDELMNNLDKEK